MLALLAFCLAGLAVNQEPIALKFVTWHTPPLSVFWWLLAAFGTGLLLGLLGISASERELRKLRSVSYHE